MKNIIFLLLLILPYSLITPEVGGAISVTFGLVYIISKKMSNFKINKTIFRLITSITLLALFDIFKFDLMSSIAGIFLYLSLLVYYLIFTNMDQKQKNIIINNSKIFILIYTAIAIIIEGVILRVRVDGLMEYANTFSLILLVFLYLNRINPFNKNNLNTVYEITLMTGILFSQSRGTFIYLIIYIIYISFIKKDKTCIKNLLIALLIYFSFASKNIIIIILMPMVIYLILIFEKYLFVLLSIAISLLAILQNKKIADTIRIFKINITSPNLQVRFIYYIDSIKAIIKKPFGYGIGSFVYLQKLQQSYNYNIRYIHNGFLQIAYDLGVVALVLFIILIVYLFISLNKLNIKHKDIYTMILITIILHSMLDFNFSFSEVMIILSYILSLIKADKEIKINYKLLPIIVAVSIYVSTQFILLKSTDYIKNNALSKKLLSISEKMAFNKDAKVYLKLAEISFINEENKNQKQTVDYLEQGYKINPYDYKFISILAVVNENIDEEESIKYYDKLLEIDRFNDKVYQRYKQYLKQISYKNESYYKKKYEEVERLRLLNRMQLNSIAKKYLNK